MKKLLSLSVILISASAWGQVQPGSIVVGAPTGGNQGYGSINAQSVYVNGVAVGGGGSGTVTSAGLTVPGGGVFGVTGSPITTSGTVAVSATGNSGGFPYFCSVSTICSTATLGNTQLIYGGGAGNAPASLTTNMAQISATSGPLSNGYGYWSNLASYVQYNARATAPGQLYGNDEEWGATADAQPVTTLGSNPLTTSNGTGTVTVNWTACCGVGGPLATSPETWVNLLNATAVGGITPTGWLKVQTIVDANDFTVTWTSNATSTATGGGASVTVQPSFVAFADKIFSVATTGASGYSLQDEKIFVANPAFFSSSLMGYQQHFAQVYSPNDATGTNPWQVFDEEIDYINRGYDGGYQPNVYVATNPTGVVWAGCYQFNSSNTLPSYIPGGGSAHNCGFTYGVFSTKGEVGTYQGFTVQPSALVGASNDPTGHGGVGYDAFGSFTFLASNPYRTTNTVSGFSVIVPGVDFVNQATNNYFYMPVGFTLNGVTVPAGSYQFTKTNSTTATVTCGGVNACTGTANSSSGSAGGTSPSIYFATYVPYAPVQFWGEYKHGIIAATNARFDTDEISLPGFTVDGSGNLTAISLNSTGTSADTPSAGAYVQRPASCTAGQTRFDSTLSVFEDCVATNTWRPRPSTILQSGLPFGLPPSGYMTSTGVYIIGIQPASTVTVTFGATSGSTTATLSGTGSAMFSGTSAGDVGRVLTILDTTYKYCTITAFSSSTAATCTISGGTLSTTTPSYANVWLSGTATTTNTAGANSTIYPAPWLLVYPNMYLYFPASSPIGAAGFKYCAVQSTTVATCYNNGYTSGTAAIPASPTAFSGLTAGTFTQTTNAYLQGPNVTLPGNSLGLNGELSFDYSVFYNTAGNNKYVQWAYGSADFANMNGSSTGYLSTVSAKIRNAGAVNQQTINFAQTYKAGGATLAAVVNSYDQLGTTDSSANQMVQLQMEMATVATDNLVIESYSVRENPN